MSMNQQNLNTLYYSQQNLDNNYKLVCDEISKRTNKDISTNTNFKKSFNQMAKMVYEKTPDSNKNLANVNTKLVESSVSFFHKKIFEKNVKQDSPPGTHYNTTTTHGFSMMNENQDIDSKFNSLMSDREQILVGTVGSGAVGSGNPESYLPQPTIKSNQFVKNEQFTRSVSANINNPYEDQFLRHVDVMQQPGVNSGLNKNLPELTKE
jgi:hypothetical protein